MKQEELNLILENHQKWLNNNGGERANLKYTNLEGANLKYANLKYANLERANLKDADLEGANLEGANLEGAKLDFSVFPLWCGSLGIKTCERFPIQLIYHIARIKIETNDEDLKELINSDLFKKVANKFHRVKECGEII